MSLTESQIEHYYREGYVVVPGLIESEVVKQVQVKALSLLGDTEAFQPDIFDREDLDANDPIVHQLLWNDQVVEAVEQLFEAPSRVYYGFLAMLPPKTGRGLPWHQDNMYQQFLGMALNTYVAIDDIEPGMGHLWIVPRSHRLGTLPWVSASEEIGTHHRTLDYEPEGAIELPTLHAGDACIFDRNTLHRSLENKTDKPRLAYAAQYVAEYARLTETGGKSPLTHRADQLKDRYLNPTA